MRMKEGTQGKKQTVEQAEEQRNKFVMKNIKRIREKTKRRRGHEVSNRIRGTVR